MGSLRALGYGFLILCWASLSCAKNTTFKIEAPGEAIFNILNFGGKDGGIAENTKPLWSAWAAACKHTGGTRRVVIPKGEFLLRKTTFYGPCSGPMVVEIIGTLKASKVPEMGPDPEVQWIGFENIDGLVVTGGGTLNNQGELDWAEWEKPLTFCRDDPLCQQKAAVVKFMNVTNGIIENITSVNSTEFHFAIFDSNNITAKRIRIIGPRNIQNTDGFFISDSTNVKIHRSYIATGDSCVTLGPRSTNILVKRITCASRHGIRIGSLATYYYVETPDVKGISVKNSTFSNAESGMAIWASPHMPPSIFSDILFQNIVLNSVKTPILIDIANCTETECPGKTSQIKINDVHFQNIKGTSTSENAIKIKCSSQYPCHNLQLSDIDLNYASTKSKSVPTFATCVNAELKYTGVQNPPPCRI